MILSSFPTLIYIPTLARFIPVPFHLHFSQSRAAFFHAIFTRETKVRHQKFSQFPPNFQDEYFRNILSSQSPQGEDREGRDVLSGQIVFSDDKKERKKGERRVESKESSRNVDKQKTKNVLVLNQVTDYTFTLDDAVTTNKSQVKKPLIYEKTEKTPPVLNNVPSKHDFFLVDVKPLPTQISSDGFTTFVKNKHDPTYKKSRKPGLENVKVISTYVDAKPPINYPKIEPTQSKKPTYDEPAASAVKPDNYITSKPVLPSVATIGYLVRPNTVSVKTDPPSEPLFVKNTLTSNSLPVNIKTQKKKPHSVSSNKKAKPVSTNVKQKAKSQKTKPSKPRRVRQSPHR